VLHIESPKGLSPTGIGPALLVTQLCLVALALVASQRWPELTRLASQPEAPLTALGSILVMLGILQWVLTLRSFLREFPRGQLIVSGPYRYCRHPLYACLTVLIVPGAALLAHTWTLLLAALAGGILASAWVVREERELDRTFGAEWRSYAARTSRLIPLPPGGGWKRSAAAVLWLGVAGVIVYAALQAPEQRRLSWTGSPCVRAEAPRALA
jgi:protein-S-isoprenylcysteine O-methyltransferase Ste14